MSSLDRQDLRRALRRLGFVGHAGGRHERWRLLVNGQDVGISTSVSRGSSSRTLSSPLVSYVAKDLKLTVSELQRAVAGSMSLQDYLQILRQNGHL